tara:strand:+ start:1160 stop:2113 length:954 start_codon:yes stop_codon:yes gene_type:complete
MRNYLQFDTNLTSKDRNNLYQNLKNNFNNHNKILLNLQNELNNETNYYKILTDKINNDFYNYKINSTFDKENLLKQYKFIINETDKKYILKKNNIYEKIKDHYDLTKNFIFELKNFYYYFKKLFQIKFYIYKLFQSKLNKNNINLNKNKFKNAVKKIMLYNKLLHNIHYPNQIKVSNLEDIQKKINNLSNIINKNDILLINLKNNINNSNNKKELKLLQKFYDNSQENKKIFGGKLNQYFIKLNNITNSIDKNNISHNNIEKNNELIKNIDIISIENQKKSLKQIKSLFKDLFHNSINLTTPNKIKNLLDKFKSLQY